MSKFRIAVLVLLAVTVIYAVTLALSVQAYNLWKEETIQYYVDHYGGDRETGIGIPAFAQYFFSTHGQYYFVFSIGLLMTWFVCLPLFSQNSKRTIVSIAGIILISVALLGIPMVLA